MCTTCVQAKACNRWKEERQSLENVGLITLDNIKGLMVQSKPHWDQIVAYIEKVIRQKK